MSLVNVTSAIFATGMPCADNSTIWARRQATDPVPLRMIRSNRLPLSDPHAFSHVIILAVPCRPAQQPGDT
ncbi:hypothetical protein ACF05L_14685 [Streptomyces bobili]|uniref:hypothetical protein n=1 Tax=Streptomyces bobili TaxID=67280 RepID=UPI003700C949